MSSDGADDGSSILRRVMRRAGGPEILDVLIRRLSGSELTTLLLAVFRARAARLRPPDVLRRYAEDRFAAPAPVPFDRIRRAEDALLSALPAEFELLTLAPVLPLGSHSVLATVDQNKLVSTARGSEVAADPTNGLALAAAVRRRDLAAGHRRDPDPVRLAALQRIVRGQRFDGVGAYQHFTLFGLVTAGRDVGALTFERRGCVEHLTVAADAVAAAGLSPARIRLTAFSPRGAEVAEGVQSALAGRTDATVVDDPERSTGRGYYRDLCFKVFVDTPEGPFELADGGLVDWTAGLLGDRKERLLISGFGVDRLAISMPPPDA